MSNAVRVLATSLACLGLAACALPSAPQPKPDGYWTLPSPPASQPALPDAVAVSVIDGHAWSDGIERVSKFAEGASRQNGGIEFERTSANELLIRVTDQASFAEGSTALPAGFAAFLDQLAELLAGQPSLRTMVTGHTDSAGSNAVNDRISQQRAYVTAERLYERGLQAQRITIDGLGERHPIADNGTPAGRARNRRVELLITDLATE